MVGWSSGSGTGLTIDPSYEMTGLPNWTNGERVARFGEYVELLDLLLAGGVTTYDGTYYQADGRRDEPGFGAAAAPADHGCRAWDRR